MNTMLIRQYYTVRILGPQNAISGDHSVPASWVRWQYERYSTVLLAFPNEPIEIIRKRVERYENPDDNWNLYYAEIIKTTYSYAVDDPYLGLSIRSSKMNKNLTTPRTADTQTQTVNNQYLAVTNPSASFASSTQKWTIKYQEYAPGLVELMPNTGVYIEEAKLRHYLKSSLKYTQLARLLTKDIFTEAALKTCQYIGSKRRSRDLRLDANATATIVKFILWQYRVENGCQITAESVRAAMNYQLKVEKTKPTNFVFWAI